MKRDTLIALVVALLLHAAFFGLGGFFRSAVTTRGVSKPDEVMPVIELLPIAGAADPVGTRAVNAETVAVSVEPEPAVSVSVPPVLKIDLPPVQPMQAPTLPSLAERGGVIVIPTGSSGGGGGLGGGGGAHGLANLFNLAEIDQAPLPTSRMPPAYPYAMRRAGVSGEVVVGFVVDSNGQVRDATVVRSSSQEFADAAIRAVQQWQFRPGRRGGVAVNTRMQVPLVFNLEAN